MKANRWSIKRMMRNNMRNKIILNAQLKMYMHKWTETNKMN